MRMTPNLKGGLDVVLESAELPGKLNGTSVTSRGVNATRRLLDYLRPSPFPADTEEYRTAERYRLATLAAFATISARLAGIGLILLTVRWAAPHLGPERFGVWATFSGLATTLAFLDLGVGNALINRVAHATASGESQRLTSAVMGGVGWLVAIGMAASVILAIASAWVPWTTLFKLSDSAAGSETRIAALIFSGLFGLNIVSTGGLKILIGQQRSHEAQLISMLGAMLAYPATWVAIRYGNSVGLLLIAGVGTQSILVIFAVLLVLARRRLIAFGRIGASMREERNMLLSTGALFLIIQVGTAIGWGCDTLLLASIAGAADVAAYAVAQRLFLFATQPVSILNGSLWAAYSDAHARGDRVFIRNTLRRSMALSLAIGTVLSLVLLIFGTRLSALWTDRSIQVPWVLLATFALWTPLEAVGIAVGYYLNGTGIIREQMVVVIVFCVLALPAKVFATMYWGATGLVAATAIAYTITHVGIYGTVYRHLIFAPMRHSDHA
jgi:O-antigen/teichoic acid export membrane protein